MTKPLRSFFLLLGGCFLLGSIHACTNEQLSPAIPTLQEGNYLVDGYLNVLTDTKSPKKAFDLMNERSGGTIRIEVNHVNGKILLNFMAGFARFVGDQYTLKENGEIKRNTNYGSDKPDFGFKLKNDSSFELLRNGKVLTYRHVDSLDTVINAKSIAGEYKDPSGKTYIFTEAGKAIFPNRTFSYSIATEFAPFEVFTGSHDELINIDVNKDAKSNVEIMKNISDYNYALEIADGELKLFKFDKNLPFFPPKLILF